MTFLVEGVVKHGHRLPIEMADAPSLEMLKAWLDWTLAMWSSRRRFGTGWPLKVTHHPNHSVSLWGRKKAGFCIRWGWPFSCFIIWVRRGKGGNDKKNAPWRAIHQFRWDHICKICKVAIPGTCWQQRKLDWGPETLISFTTLWLSCKCCAFQQWPIVTVVDDSPTAATALQEGFWKSRMKKDKQYIKPEEDSLKDWWPRKVTRCN